MKKHLRRHKDICVLWNEVQAYLKYAENATESLFITAINELRYAARKLLDVWMVIHENDKLSAAQNRKIEENLIKAEQNLENALHDISDEIIIDIRERLSDWLDIGGPDVFQAVTHKRHNLVDIISQAENLVTNSREDRSKRPEYYAKIRTEIIPSAVEKYKDLEQSLIENMSNIAARDRVIANMQKTAKGTKVRSYLALAIGIAGIAFGVFT